MKQLKTEIIALCDNASVANDGKVTITGIFDQFTADKFPAGFMEKFLVATINGEPNTTYNLTVKLEKKDVSQNLLNPTMVTATTSQTGKHNMIIRLAQVGFEKEGEYYFKIFDGKEKISETVLYVSKKTEENNVFRTMN